MTSTYSVVDLIRAKREGQTLNSDQIAWLIRAYTDDIVADEQMSAMAMAVYFQGLDDAELSAWTTAMIKSGERMSFAGLSRPTVDKHSTGGVGDKITLPLAPLVAACGAAVPQLSGAWATPEAPSTRWRPFPDGGRISLMTRWSPSSRKSAPSSAQRARD